MSRFLLDPAALVVTAAVFLTSAGFLAGSFRYFRTPDGVRTRLLVMVGVGLIVGAMELGAFVAAGHAPHAFPWLPLLFLVSANLLYYSAILATRCAPLSIAGSRDTPVHLLFDGPYRWVRHPIYTSYLLGWCGAASAIPLRGLHAILAWSGVLLMAIVYARTACAEERKFEQSAFAERYRRYRETAGLFWPLPSAIARALGTRLTAKSPATMNAKPTTDRPLSRS